MAMKERVWQLLNAGAQITNDDYAACHQQYVLKTFYFLCQRLSQSAPGSWLSGHTLEDYLRQQLTAGGYSLPANEEPLAWFGRLWAGAADGEAPEFPADITVVLLRTAQLPYQYRLQEVAYAAVCRYFERPACTNATIRQETL